MATDTLSEMEDLRLFLQERVQEFDSSIDTSIGSLFDTSVIQPLINRLGPDPYNTPIRDFILGRLQTEYPNLVLQDGEPIDDLVIKPSQVLLEAFRRQIKQISTNQSFEDPTTLNDREADSLGAKYFVRRRVGNFSVGIARLYFSSPQYAFVTPSNAVYDGGGLRFFPVENQGIMTDRMIFNTEDNLYYFDVVVKAENEGEEYNIDPNTLVGIENLPSVVKVTNKSSFTEGADKETTEEFIERVETSLTEKSLVTFRGIRARLFDTFESIRLLQVIGFGDPEMNRDILKGQSSASPYAYFSGDTSPGSLYIDLDLGTLNPIVGVDGNVYSSFNAAGVVVGDIIGVPRYLVPVIPGESYSDATVTEIVSSTRLKVDVDLDLSASGIPISIRRKAGAITISDIPGGIISPDTLAGTIEIRDGEVHIGGALDVYVRAGEPTERSIVLEGILDGKPLHFGTSLETFGELDTQRIQVTEKETNQASVPDKDRLGNTLSTLNQIVVRTLASGVCPWNPTDSDTTRYIQLLGSDWGTFKITEYLGDEYFRDHTGTWNRASRIQIDETYDYESGSSTGPFLHFTPGAYQGSFDLSFRILEEDKKSSVVRDRDGSTAAIDADDPNPGDPEITAGVNFGDLGASLGDSLVVETGEDAGIYSVRRILTWLHDNDTLVLDRDLTRTAQNLRYRVADALDVDLVSPRVVKIPMGTLFLGEDLSTVSGSSTVSVSGLTNLLTAGVETGDSLEILEGDSSGVYRIQSVTGTSAVLDRETVNTASSQKYTIYRAFSGVDRPMVRVKSIELLDSNSQPTGIEIPFGDSVDARILGRLSNRDEGTSVESYTGELQANKTDLYDPNTDFAVEGIAPGNRLNILSGSSINSYTISKVGLSDGLPSDNYIRVEPVSAGGIEFLAAESPVHYSIGIPSVGYARLYFKDPTSVEILSGLSGGRLEYSDGTVTKQFRFSEGQGHRIFPAPGESTSVSQEIRVVKSYSVGGGQYRTVLELTDPAIENVFNLELAEGDILDLQAQLPFRAIGGSTFEALGIFGTPSGLRTTAGSNRVSVPDNSKIDFSVMDASYPLVGQVLVIESGPDAGSYVIQEVVTSKVLKLDSVMTSTTQTLYGESSGTSRDATLAVSGTKIKIYDATDWGQFGTLPGQYITIFESLRGDIDGTYEITDILSDDPVPGQKAAEIDAAFSTPTFLFPDPQAVGQFSWVRSSSDTGVTYPFRVYKDVPDSYAVTQVATVRTQVTGIRRGNITAADTIEDADSGFSINASRGDLLEVLTGASSGVYFLNANSSGNSATVYTNPPFPVTGSNVAYRVWGGLYGSKTMVTVEGYSGSNGLIDAEFVRTPYALRDPSTLRFSSTEMQDQYDGTLYYMDVQIESQGSGDDFNIDRGSRLTILSGVSVDGYTYSVENTNFTFSPYEQVSLAFDKRILPPGNSDSPTNLVEVSGRNLQINYELSTVTRLVNDLLLSDADRPIDSSPIARHFLPSYVLIQLVYSGGSSESQVGKDIEDYINTQGALVELEVSDLEAFLTRRGATYVQHPLELVTLTHDLDRNLVVDRSENRIGGLNSVPYNGTGRTSAFFAKLGEGLTLVRE